MKTKNKTLNKLVIFIYVILVAAIISPILNGKAPISLGLDLTGGVIVSYSPNFDQVRSSYHDKSQEELLEDTKSIIIDRLQRSLKTIPDVYISGSNNIIVSIPNVRGAQEVLDIVGKTYHLTTRLVLGEHIDSIPGKDLYYYGGAYYELAPAYFTGDMLDQSSIEVIMPNPNSLDPGDRYPKVGIAYKPPFNKKYAEFTGKNIGRNIAILTDDEIKLVAEIKGKIFGPGTLTGRYTVEDAKNTAMLLKSGALPISLEIESLSEIGPSLGQDVQENGLQAIILSLLLLIGLIIIAYVNRLWLMVNAIFSLFFLVFSMILFVAAFNLTINFAAIAGFVLSLAMGMDAFIIIFESLDKKLSKLEGRRQVHRHFGAIVKRIYSFREEGRILFHSIISTFLAIILLVFTDRIKFFALAMLAGLGASFLTILFTRKTLTLTRELAHISTLSFLSWIRNIKTNIFQFRKIYLILTSLVITTAAILIVSSFFSENFIRLGADFKAGTQVIVESNDDSNLEQLVFDLKEEYRGIKITDQEIKNKTNPNTKRFLLTINYPIEVQSDTTIFENIHTENQIRGFGEEGVDTIVLSPVNISKVLTINDLKNYFADNKLQILSINSIDEKLSSRRFFQSMSIIFISFSLLGFYLFFLQKPIDEFFLRNVEKEKVRTHSHGWSSLGIFLALTHDFSFMILACYVLGIEIDLTVIAAMVTIIGYSVNDSIVLWGQIQHIANKTSKEIIPEELISFSIDEILSRSLITSLSTIIPAISIFILDIQELIPFAWIIIIGTVFGTLSSIFIVGSFAIKTLKSNSKPSAMVELPSSQNSESGLTAQEEDDLFNPSIS